MKRKTKTEKKGRKQKKKKIRVKKTKVTCDYEKTSIGAVYVWLEVTSSVPEGRDRETAKSKTQQKNNQLKIDVDRVAGLRVSTYRRDRAAQAH